MSMCLNGGGGGWLGGGVEFTLCFVHCTNTELCFLVL